MDSDLAQLVQERLNADQDLQSDTGLFVHAACVGDEALRALLDEGKAVTAAGGAGNDDVKSVGAYLTSITVEGFRGVGPSAVLPLQPGPGLTLITGANGSGKSSFAEGLEILLTGHNLRWEGSRSAVWKGGWRNMHHNGVVRVEATLAVEGANGETRVERHWDVGVALEGSATSLQTIRQPRGELSQLGWDEPLASLRPFLSYNELGSTFEAGPTALFDAMSSILGLNELVRARERLRQARLERERTLRTATESLDALRQSLEAVDDERARTCFKAIRGEDWDLDTVDLVLQGVIEPDVDVALPILKQLSVIDPAHEDVVFAACESLREAQLAVQAVSSTDAGRARDVADLLRSAVAFHEHFGEQSCPVCGSGQLDDDWREAAGRAVQSLSREAAEAESADRALATAIAGARGLMLPVPEALDRAEAVGIDAADLSRAWVAWLTVPNGGGAAALADHLEQSLPRLLEAAGVVREASSSELDRREDAWRPVAGELLKWLPGARAAERGRIHIGKLSAAEKWLGAATAGFREERFAPVADHAATIWERLRQGSSVELERLGLVGSGTHRRLSLDVRVDGAEGAALGVMSQGELHALALSLFLPRATLEKSPFRFVVIDDPVQAMDPSKVDGLAKVLDDIARVRQVVVFTHDDRLPEAVRRLGIAAGRLEVTRRGRSVVEVRRGTDPVARYLDDARALVRTEGLTADIAARVVPAFCRNALEAACTDAFRRRRLLRGAVHRDVELALESATTLTAKAALALFDDQTRGGDVMSRINARYGRSAGDTFKDCNSGSHLGLSTARLSAFVDQTESLARDLATLE